MTFHPSSAWFLLLLPLALLAWWNWIRPARRSALFFSCTTRFDGVPQSVWSRLRPLVPSLRTIALALVVLAIARPVKSNESTKTFVEGVAIEMVLDRSGSMRAHDFTIGGKDVERLTALKAVARDFVAGGKGMPGRINDLVGVVTFAGFADALVPLTLDHDVVLDALKQLRTAQQDEDGTAIGDALALGVEKLKDAADRANADGEMRIRSKVLLLLTDGENNAGELEPTDAAELAAACGVKIYAIGMGTKGLAPFPMETPFGTQFVQQPVNIDEALLTKLSEKTGGQYFRATDTDSLLKIYETIDQLEKSKVEEQKLVRYRDYAVEPFAFAGFSVPPVLALALLVLCAELLLSSTRLRVLP
ncbi:MAG: VWA domain-containing protein [Phycisphaerales bacterium]|nr:VWA domain-containing protein [Phycisphaerales bacterium]